MGRLIKLYKHFSQDSLYRNSIYLMLSTASLTISGFIFWIVCARLFNPDQVGIATALISVMALISNFSLLGLGNSLIKYLPSSDMKNDKVNTSFTLVGLTTIFASSIFLVFLKAFSPKLLFVRENLFFTILFILIIILYSLNLISEYVFIAHRSSVYVLIKNTIFGIARLFLPFVFIALGAYGIFISFGSALIVSFLFCLFIFISKYKYILKPSINIDIVKILGRFSLGNYLAGFIGSLPMMVLPILITNSIGAAYSAYFYMDSMIANLLYIIPIATSQSLLAEGSYSESELKIHLKKAIRIISLIILPAIALIVLSGRYILLAFGKNYSNEGIIFLWILALSGIFISINYIGSTIFFIKHKVKLVIFINLLGSAIIFGISYLLISKGLLGIGIAWATGQAIMSLIYLASVFLYKE
jgi:O-antigen/teichoic acid export membrane protein